jgi:hypothetical protein
MRLAVLLLLASSIAHAEPKVAMLERAKFEEPGGIARWLAARAQLDVEKKSFHFVESDGKPIEPSVEACKPPIKDYMKDLCAEWKKQDFKNRGEEVWKLREAEVLGPIEEDLDKAIVAYAKSRGIELLLEKYETGVIYMAPNVDITAAFIKDYNAKHPVAKPKPQPRK